MTPPHRTIKLLLLPLHSCDFATVTNHNLNIFGDRARGVRTHRLRATHCLRTHPGTATPGRTQQSSLSVGHTSFPGSPREEAPHREGLHNLLATRFSGPMSKDRGCPELKLRACEGFASPSDPPLDRARQVWGGGSALLECSAHTHFKFEESIPLGWLGGKELRVPGQCKRDSMPFVSGNVFLLETTRMDS